MAKLTSLQAINSNEVNLQDGLYLAHKINDNPDTYEDRRININKLAGALPTGDIKYNNTESGLTATNVQGAIDELAAGGCEVLNDLTDVTISSLAANQLLQYNSTTGKWENKSLNIILPDPPTTDGTYTLTCTVTSGVPTYSWM